MMPYLFQPRNQIFVKDYEFLYFAKNMGKTIGKKISKNLSDKYSPDMLALCQKLLDHAKEFAIDTIKTFSFKKQQKQLLI